VRCSGARCGTRLRSLGEAVVHPSVSLRPHGGGAAGRGTSVVPCFSRLAITFERPAWVARPCGAHQVGGVALHGGYDPKSGYDAALR
jgi:hypothetical protein